MNTQGYTQYFKEIGITVPFDVMRAKAILNAAHDAQGLSIISFNISAFLKKSRYESVYKLLELWATRPLYQNNHSDDLALSERVQTLYHHFSQSPHMDSHFVETAFHRMIEAVECVPSEGTQTDSTDSEIHLLQQA